MKRNLFLFCVSLMIVFLACNENVKQEDNKVDSTKIQTTKPIDPAVTASLFAQFNGLEKVFDNQNWMVISGKDTSYLYISRLNKFLAYSHSYRMIKGDSALLRIDTIHVNSENKIIWNWNDKHLELAGATENTIHWQNDSTKIEFAKMDAANLVMTINEKEKIKISKTLTLSTFLVRSFYDYQHGTKLAFDQKEYIKK